MVKLDSKTPEELVEWLPQIWEHYVSERIKAGEDPDSARKGSQSQREQLFPDDRPADGQFVMNILADGDVVGTLWMGKPFSGPEDTWFVFDVEIAKEHRGRGYGRAAMEAAEDWTRERGGTRVGLNVFGPNLIARSLYDSLGYEVLATAMFKDL
jgi:ribosomal protein S18 acetylase RimI-like enzyme